MVVSLILLATSQWFWLKSEYREQKLSFYNNSDLLFKETVRTVEDSLISKAIIASGLIRIEEKKKNAKKKSPPVPNIRKIEIFHHNGGIVQGIPLDSSKGMNAIPIDSITHIRGLKDSTVKKILINLRGFGREDSINKVKRVISQLPRISVETDYHDDKEQSRPRRRFNLFSANKDTVDKIFNARIKELGYPITFTIRKDSLVLDSAQRANRRPFRSMIELHRKLKSSSDSLEINGVRLPNPELVSAYSIDPTVIFEAKSNDLDSYLFSRLRNNFLFSAGLLFLTALTFFLIYRNLQKQARLNEVKNDLISNVSHELKTPLATISVALEALQQFGGKEDPRLTNEYLEISRNEVSRLSHMVDNILNTALLENQAITISTHQVNMYKLVADVVKAWQPRLDKLQGLITLETEGVDFEIEADEVQLINIITNLIDNGVKYAKGSPQLNLKLTEEKDRVTLSVKDNGIGIPKEFQNQVFEKFFRVPTGDKHNVKGYGLGLNYVKHIVDLHHGNVHLSSGQDGTTFTLTLKKKL